MKQIILILFIMVLFAGESSAQNETQTDVQITLKIKYLNYEPDTGGHRVFVDFMTDKPGKLIYKEEYYKYDLAGTPQFVKSMIYYDKMLKENSVSFEIVRPKKADIYTTIKGIIIIDEQIVFKDWINYGTYGYKNSSNTSSSSLFPTRAKQNIEQRTMPMNSDNILIDIFGHENEKILNKQSTFILILAILIIYFYKLREDK